MRVGVLPAPHRRMGLIGRGSDCGERDGVRVDYNPLMRRAFLILAVAFIAFAMGIGFTSNADTARRAEGETAASTLARETLRVIPDRVDGLTKVLRTVAAPAELAVVATVALGALLACWYIARDPFRRARAATALSGGAPRAPPPA